MADVQYDHKKDAFSINGLSSEEMFSVADALLLGATMGRRHKHAAVISKMIVDFLSTDYKS